MVTALVISAVRLTSQPPRSRLDGLPRRSAAGASLRSFLYSRDAFDRACDRQCALEMFNATVEMADKRGLPSGEHFSVDGTLIQTPQTHLRHSERSHRELVDFYRRRYVCAPPHGDTGGSQVLSAGAFP
jgi:hypothetical protein